MKPWTLHGRRVVAIFAISAVLFAPATYESPPGWTLSKQAPIETRILAPTLREGMVAAKLSAGAVKAGDRSQPKAFAYGISAAVGAVLLIAASFALRLSPRRSFPGLAFFRSSIPRGPPGLQAVQI